MNLPYARGKAALPAKEDTEKDSKGHLDMPPKDGIHGSERTRFLAGRCWRDLTFWREGLQQ